MATLKPINCLVYQQFLHVDFIYDWLYSYISQKSENYQLGMCCKSGIYAILTVYVELNSGISWFVVVFSTRRRGRELTCVSIVFTVLNI